MSLGQMASHRAIRYSFLKFLNFKKAAAAITFAGLYLLVQYMIKALYFF